MINGNYLEPDKVKMKNITINIPKQYDSVIQKLIELKLTPNRSEAIRTALREFLSEEFENLELLDEFQELELSNDSHIN